MLSSRSTKSSPSLSSPPPASSSGPGRGTTGGNDKSNRSSIVDPSPIPKKTMVAATTAAGDQFEDASENSSSNSYHPNQHDTDSTATTNSTGSNSSSKNPGAAAAAAAETNKSDDQRDVLIDGRYTKATDLDCLCLKNPTHQQRLHPGNFLFRKVIIEHSKEFREADNSHVDSSSKKAKVTEDVLEAFRNLNGRLLQPPGMGMKPGRSLRGAHGANDPDALWEEVDHETAFRKVKNSLRSCIRGEGFYAVRWNDGALSLSPDGKPRSLNDHGGKNGEAERAGKDYEEEDEEEENGKDIIGKPKAAAPPGKTNTSNVDGNSSTSSPSIQPTTKDYLITKGGSISERRSPGSIEFRQILEDHAQSWVWDQDIDTYAESREKLINSIYDTFIATGGRVLKRLDEKNRSSINYDTWIELSRDDVIERIKKNSSQLRLAMSHTKNSSAGPGPTAGPAIITSPTTPKAAPTPVQKSNNKSTGQSPRGPGRPPKNAKGPTSPSTESPSGKRRRGRPRKYPRESDSTPQQEQQQKQQGPLEIIGAGSIVLDPFETDYLCIRAGNKFPDRPGNQNYRRIIQENALDYQRAPIGPEKTAVVIKAWEEFKQTGGRILLQEDSKSYDRWKVDDEESSKIRVRKALAGCMTPQKGPAREIKINLESKRGTRHGGSSAATRTDAIKIYKPNKEDYLSVPSGTTPNEHINNPGNLEYRRLIESRAQAYCNAATTDRKLSIRSSILNEFHRTGGRVLAQVPGKGTAWYEVDENSALATISNELVEWHNMNNVQSSPEKDDDRSQKTDDVDEKGDTSSDDEEDDEKSIVELTPKDCLCVMNVRKDQMDHPGNSRFNELVEKHSLRYWKADTSKDEKREIREKIVRDFLKTGGRFVSPIGGSARNEPGCSWVKVDFDIATLKVGNVFRRLHDKSKAKLREMARKEKSDRKQKRKSSMMEQEEFESDSPMQDDHKSTVIMEHDLRPADYVFCGGTGGKYPGNKAVKKIIKSSAQLYYDCGDNEEFQKGIREMILTAVHAYGGRFLAGINRASGSPPWEELDDQTALNKIHRRLREFPGVDRSSSPSLKESGSYSEDEEQEASGKESSASGTRRGLFGNAEGDRPAKKRKLQTGAESSSTAVAFGDYQGSIWGASTGHDEYGISHQEEYSDIEDLVF